MLNQKGFCRPNNPTNSRSKWILCRLTSMLPGKYYWFNRHTGESAWSDECNSGKPQQKRYNNTFGFPLNYQINNYPHPKPMNNQSYHQSIQRLPPPGLKTSLNQPMISQDLTFSEISPKCNDLKRKSEQTTQGLIDNSYLVHSTSQELHIRFQNTKFDSEHFKQAETLEIPMKRTRMDQDGNENFILSKKDVWTMTHLNEEINTICHIEFDNNSLLNINTTCKVDKEANTYSKSMFSPIHDEEVQNKEVQVTETKEIESGWRLGLLERKFAWEENMNEDGINKDDTKQCTVTSNKKALESVKKRVRFGDENDDLCHYPLRYYEDREPSHELFEDISYTKINIARLKNLSTCPVNDVWYIAVDLPSLIADYDFLIKLVNSDTACTLLIPKQVKNTLDAQCKGSCLGRQEVMLLRNVSRDLDNRRDKICVQALETKEVDILQNIFVCCTEKTVRGHYVVLITTDAELRRRCFLVEPYNIPTFTIGDIKEFVTKCDQNKPRTKPKTVAVTQTIPNANATVPNSKSLFECFASQSFNNSLSTALENIKFPVNNSFANKKTTFLPNNNDETLFKIPTISKQIGENMECHIEEKLKAFKPSSNEVGPRFKLARDSWICSFSQIVEDGLTYILQPNEEVYIKLYPPPWTFLESIECVKLLVTKEANILTRLVVDKLLQILMADPYSTAYGFINKNIQYEEYQKIFGLTYLLFEEFKKNPNYSIISSKTLSNLEQMFASLNDVTSQPDAIFHSIVPTRGFDIPMPEGNKVIKQEKKVVDYLGKLYSQFKRENIVFGNDNYLDMKKVTNERSIRETEHLDVISIE